MSQVDARAQLMIARTSIPVQMPDSLLRFSRLDLRYNVVTLRVPPLRRSFCCEML